MELPAYPGQKGALDHVPRRTAEPRLMARSGRALTGIFGAMLDKLLRTAPPPGKRLGTRRFDGDDVPGPAHRAIGGSADTVLATDRLQHGSRHLSEAGLLPPWRGRTSPGLIHELLAPIIESPSAVVTHQVGDDPVKGYVGEVGGRTVVAFEFLEGELKGTLATAFIANENQLRKWGLR